MTALRIVYPLLWSRPGRQACREQTLNTVAALARRGEEVTLLMPRGAKDPSLTAEDLRRYFDVEGDFQLVQRPSRWAGEHAIPSTLWLRQLFRDPRTRSSDLLYARIPALLALGSRSPIPFAIDHYRPWPDDLPLLRPFIRQTARSPRCLGLFIHSSYAAESYRRIGVPPGRIVVAHNGAEPRRMGAPLGKSQARNRLGLPQDRAVAVYAGRINLQKGLDQLLALAALRPDVLFLLVGSEGEGPIEAQARACANIRILPWQDPAGLAPYLYAADALLIPPSSAPLEQFRNCVLPMKLFAYLAAGRPILAPHAPDTAELLTDGDTALLTPSGNPGAAAAALDRILHEPGLAERLSANARRLSQDLSWDKRAEKISTFLRSRLKELGRG